MLIFHEPAIFAALPLQPSPLSRHTHTHGLASTMPACPALYKVYQLPAKQPYSALGCLSGSLAVPSMNANTTSRQPSSRSPRQRRTLFSPCLLFLTQTCISFCSLQPQSLARKQPLGVSHRGGGTLLGGEGSLTHQSSMCELYHLLEICLFKARGHHKKLYSTNISNTYNKL